MWLHILCQASDKDHALHAFRYIAEVVSGKVNHLHAKWSSPNPCTVLMLEMLVKTDIQECISHGFSPALLLPSLTNTYLHQSKADVFSVHSVQVSNTNIAIDWDTNTQINADLVLFSFNFPLWWIKDYLCFWFLWGFFNKKYPFTEGNDNQIPVLQEAVMQIVSWSIYTQCNRSSGMMKLLCAALITFTT